MIALLLATLALAPQDTSTVYLPTIQVRISRDVERPVLELPFAVTRLFPDSMRPGLRNATIDERLALVPGLTVANRNNPTQDPRISIRGFGSRSAFGVRGVRVVLDGIPLTLPDGQTALDYLDLEAIGSIEVIRGSASSLYGNAAGGVVSLRSAPYPGGTPGYSLSGWDATYGQSKYSASIGSNSAALDYNLSLSHTEYDGFRAHSRQRLSNGSIRVGGQLGAFRIDASLLAHDMPLAENPGALTLAEMQSDPRAAEQLAVRRNARKEVSQQQLGVVISTGDAARGRELELVLHGGSRDLYNPLQFAIINVDRSSYGLSLRGSSEGELLGLRAFFTAGVDYQAQNDDRTEFTNCNELPPLTSPTATCPDLTTERGTLRRDQKELVSSIGPFARAELQLSERFRLSLGARADRVNFEVQDHFIDVGNPNNQDDSGERTLSAFSPMGGLVFRASPLTSLYATWSTAFETPTATELTNKPDGSAGFNPELDPQRSGTLELGARGWVGALLENGFTYDLSLYQTAVEDELIPFEITGGAGRRFFRNAGSTSRTGVELMLAAALGSCHAAITINYSDFTFDDYEAGGTTFDGRRIPGVPMRHAQSALTCRSSGWYATLEGEARSGMYMDDMNSARASGYEVMNLRLGSLGLPGLRHVQPRVGVQNLFDRNYAGAISVNASNGRYFEPAPGRIIYLGVTVR